MRAIRTSGSVGEAARSARVSRPYPNHQGLGNQLITSAAVPETPSNDDAPIRCRGRLGGLLNFYYRRPA